jgi:oxepin-CoA hydrolase/3-oxo-5,6-dehydrosuberyl-CoA semialdehyde dehydrogenase
MLRSNPHLLENSVRFIAEQDSLNASMLGPDATPAARNSTFWSRKLCAR